MAAKKEKDPSATGGRLTKAEQMDQLKKEILYAVCVASVVVGFSLVGALYLVRTIMYNIRLSDANGIVIETYKGIQANLEKLNEQVGVLSANENFEAVAQKRDVEKCSNYTSLPSLSVSSADELEIYKTCSSLRAISDTLPSRENSDAMLASLNQLLNWSNEGEGVNFEGLSGRSGSNITSAGFDAVSSPNLHIMNSSVTMNDTSDAIRSALDVLENSIRNYDIVQAQISFDGGNIELVSTFASYYSDTASLTRQKRVVCASYDHEKCQAAGGDTAYKEKQQAEMSGTSSTSSGGGS